MLSGRQLGLSTRTSKSARFGADAWTPIPHVCLWWLEVGQRTAGRFGRTALSHVPGRRLGCVTQVRYALRVSTPIMSFFQSLPAKLIARRFSSLCSEEAAIAQRDLLIRSRNFAAASAAAGGADGANGGASIPAPIKRIKLSQRPVKSRPQPSSLRTDDHGEAALVKLRLGIAESLQAESSHDDSTLAWQVITELWLHPTFSLDALHQRPFFLLPARALELCAQAHALFEREENVLNIEGPTKIFGDIHGQFDDLCRLFKAFGSPDHHIGDIEENSYVFLGDIVDRGRYSLEVLCLLLALKIQYPHRVFLVRGNHEDNAMNKNYGFGQEVWLLLGAVVLRMCFSFSSTSIEFPLFRFLVARRLSA